MLRICVASLLSSTLIGRVIGIKEMNLYFNFPYTLHHRHTHSLTRLIGITMGIHDLKSKKVWITKLLMISLLLTILYVDNTLVVFNSSQRISLFYIPCNTT